jgi:hypothetical protein
METSYFMNTNRTERDTSDTNYHVIDEAWVNSCELVKFVSRIRGRNERENFLHYVIEGADGQSIK